MNVKNSPVRANVECDDRGTFEPVPVMRRSSSRLEYWTICSTATYLIAEEDQEYEGRI